MMDIRKMAQDMAKTAFAATNAPKAITILRPVTGQYDAVTGAVAQSQALQYATTGIVSRYSQKEVDGTSILASDLKATLLRSMVSQARTVTTQDAAVVDGQRYCIVNVDSDALDLTWVLQLRK